jgi:translation initiation factor 3 subunit D
MEDDCVQIGLAARVTPKDNHSHVLLATSQQKPRELASQLNIKMGNCWAIVRYIVDLCFKLEKDSYVLMKDPNKQLMYLYEVPSNAFTTQEDDDDVHQGTPLPSA